MDRMIERVARALCKRRGSDPDKLEPGDLPVVDGLLSNGDPAHFLWRQFEDDARAAIEAMREPTVAMMQAYDDAQPRGIGAEGWASADDALAAMVDAALSEPPSSTEGAS